MNVLSLFDGISCGQVALERAGIDCKNYYASEIDKNAIKVTQFNYPKTIQLGDINNIDFFKLPKIDLLIGGSPCQGFSFAGKQLNFSDPRSALFFKFVDALKILKPKYFLLENVRMKKEYQDVISKYLEVKPININSKLVSAQLRNRYYWTNLKVDQPKNKNIKLKDIIESGYVDREKARAILESDSRPLNNKEKMEYRYKTTGFTTLVYEKANLDYKTCRYFTQQELEKLQTLPVGYTQSVKRDIAAGLIGNGWTVDVITHIFKGLK